MPVITVYGFPKDAPDLEELPNKLISAITSVRELKLSTNQVSVFFPADLVQKGLGEELIAFVDALLVRPERTPRILHELAKAITATLSEYARNNLPQCNLVEAVIRPVDLPEYNFHCSCPRRNFDPTSPA